MPSHCVVPENVHTCTSPIEGIFSKTPLPLPTPLEIPIKLHTFLYILGSYRTPHPTGSSNPFCGRGGIDIFWTCTLSQTSRLSFWASNCLLSLAWWARHQASHLLTKSLKRKLRIWELSVPAVSWKSSSFQALSWLTDYVQFNLISDLNIWIFSPC